MKREQAKYYLKVCAFLVLILLGLEGISFADEEKQASERMSPEKEGMWNRFQEFYQRSSDVGKEWTKEELERIGDWQYRVVTIQDADDEKLEVELNALGEERWEVIWLERIDEKWRLFAKRPKTSTIKSVSEGKWMNIIPRLMPLQTQQEE